MTQNKPLHVAYTANNPPKNKMTNSQSRRQEIQAQMERMWLENPHQFDPQRDCMERQRLHTTFSAIQAASAISGKMAADLGCGSGTLSRMLRDAGAHVDAMDVAGNALALLKAGNMENITPIQDCLPNSGLKDNSYDILACTETIAYLRQEEYRILMAELARLVKKEGIAVCSTPLDMNTQNPLDRFAALAETEFSVDKWIVHYHLLLIKFCTFFETPKRYIDASRDKHLRAKEVAARKGIGSFWFKINSCRGTALLWSILNLAARPIACFLRQNYRLMKILESTTRFFWSDAGISHVLFIGKRRPLTYDIKQTERPIEPKHKRQVWE